MRTRAILAALACAATLVAAPAASAGPTLPLTQCQMQELLGYDNVRECEDPPR